jgi:hypothetical protein
VSLEFQTPEVRLMWQMRSVALALALATGLGSFGCMSINKREHDVDRTPIVNTGAGATILYPGRSVAMPPPVHPRNIGAPVAPGGSSQGATSGYPPQQPAPQGYPQQQGYPPQSGAPAPQGQASSGAPAYTPEYASAQPSSGGGGLTMLGGTSVEEDRHARIDEEPLYFKYLALPFAVAAAPFKYVYEKARGEHQPGPAVPTLDKTAQPPQPSAAPQDYETRRLEQMERELGQQQPQAVPPQNAPPQSAALAPAPAARPGARSGGPSMADELSMLRQPAGPVIAAYAPGSAPVPAPAPSAATPTPDASPTPASTRPPAARVAGASGQVDRDGDGRPDQWIFRANGDLAREVFDEDFDGRPDRTLIYDPTSHDVVAIEEDSDHDGQVDTWTALQKGQVQRRRIDSNGDGQVDTWESYRDGQLVRIERDTNGDGFRDRISSYEQGRLAREEEDDDGDGRIEATRYYDDSEKLSRVEEDANGDGQVDVVSHYENGKLTSREILDTSMLKNTSGQL